MTYSEHLETIKNINRHYRYYKSVESLFELDQWSALPREGYTYRQQMGAFMTEQKIALFFAPEAKRATEYFAGVPLKEIEDYVPRGLIRKFLFQYRNAVRTPMEKQRQYSLLRAECMNRWKEAREKRDYHIFMPWLKQVFDLKREIAAAINPDIPAFDTLVGLTDEGLSVFEVSEQFDQLKTGIGALLEKINQSSVGELPDFMEPDLEPERIAAFSRRLVREMGYQESRGAFNDKVIHAFTSFLGPRDARISTGRGGSLKLLFTYLHEAGHAMYAGGGNERVNKANMWGGIEGGFHEANARFYENMVGRSRAYWAFYYPQLQAEFPQFADVDPDLFYRAIHTVKPGLRRIAADEVTYSLHAVLRFELERDYFSGVLKAEDMANVWNDKYEAYLGIRPADDTEGILQDMHWAGDYIGYFQSYALGNIYDGQILAAIKTANPDLYRQLGNGNFESLNAWMQEHIWQYGCCFTGGELIRRISGRGLDAQPFLKYLNKKYSELYQLDQA